MTHSPSAPDQAGPGDLADRSFRVLIVEDEVLVALEASDILASAGHDVIGSAVTAEEAVRKARELKPDLILMDIRLLGKRDGIEAATEIWQRLGLRSLFVSAYSDRETTARAAEANPIGFLAKPFTEDSLLDAVRRLAPAT
jgi:DNA-binding NarL/FixJ family response regulator